MDAKNNVRKSDTGWFSPVKNFHSTFHENSISHSQLIIIIIYTSVVRKATDRWLHLNWKTQKTEQTIKRSTLTTQRNRSPKNSVQSRFYKVQLTIIGEITVAYFENNTKPTNSYTL